jgi:hypothetical protein
VGKRKMDKIHINSAANAQLDYAVAVAQGWVKTGDSLQFWGMPGEAKWIFPVKMYKPTQSQAQCMVLIINSKMSCKYIDKPGFVHHEFYYCRANKCECGNTGIDKNLLIAAVKAFLWSKYPDGYLPVSGDNHG